MSDVEVKHDHESLTRLALFPLRSDEHSVWQLYNKQEENSWGVSEINLSDDRKQWDSLTVDQTHLYIVLCAFFTVGDRPVVASLESLENHVSPNDLVRKMFIASQTRIECVHMHAYGLFTEEVIPDKLLKERIFNSVENYESVKAKVELILKYQAPGTDLRIMLLAQACAEGIGFSTAFAGALYFRTIGKMYGFGYGNSKIMQDEFIHCNHAYDWLNTLKALDDKTFYGVVDDYVKVEKKFAEEMLRGRNLGILNEANLVKYAKFIADLVCMNCNKKPKYDISENPLPYMDVTALRPKTNFFEKTVGEYGQISKDKASKELIIDFKKRV